MTNHVALEISIHFQHDLQVGIRQLETPRGGPFMRDFDRVFYLRR